MFAVAYLWVRVLVTGAIGGDTQHPSLRNLSMGQRSLLMLGLVPRIGRLLVWPDHLFADYSPQMVPGYEGWTINLIPGAMMLLCVAILFAVSWRRAPVVCFGIAWFVIAYSPVSNILIPSGILIAERTFMAPRNVSIWAGVIRPAWLSLWPANGSP